ncbi:MAG TPA: glutamate synthase [Candidatus Dormibacteraeota bacterium]|jgi:glutamate synthase domain-containing protein 1/glutamate synthase domain-containing protein 3|nr:glutamate synthase [Candidatus Dormibacteraeota bacterium]
MKLDHAIIESRTSLQTPHPTVQKQEAEGGCGVVGLASNVPLGGKYLLQSLVQMRNRGNGKGGGIAALGLVPEELGVSERILEEDYILQVAYLDRSARKQVEDEHIRPFFRVDHESKVPTVDDFHSIAGLEVEPPEVYRYFVRVKPEVLDDFARRNSLPSTKTGEVEDEFVYQNSYRLNLAFYSSLGEKKAFVVSHGKNMVVLKLVGFGDDVVKYYKLEDFRAHVWIGHHRYPTKGRVWHPGGAHPFVGLHEALVHNGDFANYHSIVEYLAQRKIHPLFLTDTEVSVLLFDLISRVYKYPVEYLVEALAPTTERDFEMLPDEKKKVYRLIQTSHIHGSPDGPWFFIVARNDVKNKGWQLLGITDTSMLRPQVFAIQEGPIKIGIIASERQAINAVLAKLQEDHRIPSRFADVYWNARGGSYTDGGAFLFTVKDGIRGKDLVCTDKFGRETSLPAQEWLPGTRTQVALNTTLIHLQRDPRTQEPSGFYEYIRPALRDAGFQYASEIIEELKRLASKGQESRTFAIQALTLLYDRIYDTGNKKRSSLLQLYQNALNEIFSSVPISNFDLYTRLDWKNRTRLGHPGLDSQVLVVDAIDFPVEGDESAARFLVQAYFEGWRNIALYNLRGHRFIGNGLGPRTNGLKVDCYGDVGDYVASGIDGCEIVIHGAAQDQAGQILKFGKLVVHGDVGQAFMYAAKGGEVFVQGNAAGRPLINAVGRPKVVINGTCLDYLAESFMAGDPYNGGGFVVVNGLKPSFDGRFIEQDYPYPGSNLFSLASGGAIFIRDPYRKVSNDQLNGGQLAEFTEKDWRLILPFLEENERLFGISVRNDLLSVGGKAIDALRVYRKIEPIPLEELA